MEQAHADNIATKRLLDIVEVRNYHQIVFVEITYPLIISHPCRYIIATILNIWLFFLCLSILYLKIALSQANDQSASPLTHFLPKQQCKRIAIFSPGIPLGNCYFFFCIILHTPSRVIYPSEEEQHVRLDEVSLPKITTETNKRSSQCQNNNSIFSHEIFRKIFNNPSSVHAWKLLESLYMMISLFSPNLNDEITFSLLNDH